MESEHVLAKCRELLGLPSGEDLSICLERLERLLSNFAEKAERKDRARTCLRWIRDHAGDRSASHEAMRLLSVYREEETSSPPTPSDEEFIYLVVPEDPAWLPWIDKYSQASDRSQVRAFGGHLVQIIHNSLLRTKNVEEALLRAKTVVETVLRMGPRLDTQSRLKLEEWNDQIAGIEARASATEILQNLQRAYQEQNWDQLKDLLSEPLEERVLTSEQRITLSGLREEIETYFHWRDQFQNQIQALQSFTPTAQRPLPWPDLIAVQDIQSMQQGLTQWGAPVQRQALDTVLNTLAGAAINCLLANKQDPQQQLEVIKEYYHLWQEGVDKATFPWQETLTPLWEQMDARFTRWVEDLRPNYEGVMHVEAPFTRLSPRAHQELARLYEEIRTLKELDGQLHRWQSTADLRSLDSAEQAQFRRQLEALEPAWGKAPYYCKLVREFNTLFQDLGQIAKALTLRDEGELEGATELFKAIQSPVAQALLRETEQLILDARLTRSLQAGEWDEAVNELGRASPGMQHLYQQMQVGRRFIEQRRLRGQELKTVSPFTVYAEQILRLLATPLDLQLCAPDRILLQELDEDIRDGLSTRAEQEIEALLRDCAPYPLMEQSRLQGLRMRYEDLQTGLSLPGLSTIGGPELLRRLRLPGAIIAVHEFCHAGAWEQAAQSLIEDGQVFTASRSAWGTQKALQATLQTARLSAQKAGDEEWLAVYLSLSDILLQREPDRRHYLALLRTTPLTRVRLAEHINVLDTYCSDKSFLRGVVRLAADPSSAPVELRTKAPSEEDLALFGRVLRELVQEGIARPILQEVWQGLNDAQRQTVWPGSPGPLELQQQRFEEQMDQFRARMQDPKESLYQVRADFRKFQQISGGQPEPRFIKQLDQAVGLEQRMEDLDRRDPWSRESLIYVRDVEKRMGSLPIEVYRARGWDKAVQARTDGMRVWDNMERYWQEFRAKFERVHTLYPSDSSPLTPFLESLKSWCDRLEEAAQELDWDLPRTGESSRWKEQVTRWRETREGLLWLVARDSEPKNIWELLTCYQVILEQMRDFSELHRELIASVPTYNPNPNADLLAQLEPALVQLKDCRALSSPVEKVRDFLVNPDIGNVGAVYRAWVRAGIS